MYNGAEERIAPRCVELKGLMNIPQITLRARQP